MPGKDEKDAYAEFLEWLRKFLILHYGPPKKSNKVEKRREKLPPKLKPKESEKPRASDDDLLGVLHVVKEGGVDLKIKENAQLHHTDKYYQTRDEDNKGNPLVPDLVVRRGQEFQMVLTFDRPYNVEQDDLSFKFITGELGDTRKATHGHFKLDETGKEKYRPDKWGGRLIKQDGCTIVAEVYIPATCAIGEWSFEVFTHTKGHDKAFCYDYDDEFFILFNPWCPDDDTYMEKEEERDEYVLNDSGKVFRGSAWWPSKLDWNFGQFEKDILEDTLMLVMKCFNSKTRHKMRSPVQVARVIAQVVNCNDADRGLLVGNWSGQYEDGKNPGHWSGSPAIIHDYMKNGMQPVKYGQCWVFSGLTTTLCRALGIPARSVTNYGSAHDNDSSNCIDYVHGRDEKGQLQRISSKSDSIWNYHLWNDVWFRRRDIRNNTGQYDGWQAIDGTPQEKSKGVFTCGPCPLNAIWNGDVTVPYDCGFVFTEVNGDVVEWELMPDGSYVKLRIKPNKVGTCVLTKAVEGSYTFDDKSDITDSYKPKEGSVESKKAVLRAALGAKNPKDIYGSDEEQDDVEFKLEHKPRFVLGEDIEVKLKAVNKSEYKRESSCVQFRFIPSRYTGHGSSNQQELKCEEFKEESELVRNQEQEFKSTLKFEDYYSKIDNERTLTIQAIAMVKKTRSRPPQDCVKVHTVTLEVPTLEVEMPASAKAYDEVVAAVSFTNPLPMELTNCTAGYEGRGFDHKNDIPQPKVPAKGKCEMKFSLKYRVPGNYQPTFKFNSEQLNYLSGAGKIKVE